MNRRAFLAALPPALLVTRLHAADKNAASLVSVLQPNVVAGSLAGAVTLVTDKDKVLDVGAIGYSDVVAKAPMRTDAEFWIASMSKPITATALMILVDEDSVKLDDPIAKYLPEFHALMVAVERDAEHVLLKKPMRPPTVRDCLRHTSGMPFQSAMEVPTIDVLPLRDAVRSYSITPLAYEPGTKHVYSNAGINTAGRIIEVVSKMPYESFLDQRLFGPLGMTDTTFWPNPEQVKRLAKSYTPGEGGKGLAATTIRALGYPLTDRAKRYPVPAGGLFSTAADLGRFCRMLLSGGTHDGKKMVSADAIAEMSKRQTPKTVPQSYGLGWSVGGGGAYGHGGAYATNMTIDPKQGLAYVYMVQRAGLPGDGGLGAFRKAAEAKYGSGK
jgi:CubicO group peptidase (beta-lactamase class C family)